MMLWPMSSKEKLTLKGRAETENLYIPFKIYYPTTIELSPIYLWQTGVPSPHLFTEEMTFTGPYRNIHWKEDG